MSVARAVAVHAEELDDVRPDSHADQRALWAGSPATVARRSSTTVNAENTGGVVPRIDEQDHRPAGGSFARTSVIFLGVGQKRFIADSGRDGRADPVGIGGRKRPRRGP